MIIKELQILSEGLWESAKTNLVFFSPIQTFIKRLSELEYLNSESVQEANLYIQKIEEYFDKYRKIPGVDPFYSEPHLISSNNESVLRIQHLIKQLNSLTKDQLNKEIQEVSPVKKKTSKGTGKVFIGHGRSKLWARVQIFLKEDLNIETLVFEDDTRTSESIVNVLESFLDNSSFAILILTAEDDTANGTSRARQNVIHEAGLFQGRLGFDKVIILKQEGIEEFSNIAGLQYVPFTGENIEQCFYEIQRKFKKLGLIQ